MKKKRRFLSSVGSFRPCCNGVCLVDHSHGDLIPLTYCLVIILGDCLFIPSISFQSFCCLCLKENSYCEAGVGVWVVERTFILLCALLTYSSMPRSDFFSVSKPAASSFSRQPTWQSPEWSQKELLLRPVKWWTFRKRQVLVPHSIQS